MKAVSRGFRTMRQGDARIESYSLDVNHGPSYDNSPTHLTDWTYYQGVHARVSMLVDLNGALRAIGSPDATLEASLGWSCRRTGLRGVGMPVTVSGGEMILEVSIPDGLLRGQLQLTPRVFLSAPGSTSEPGAPKQRGATLWQPQVPIQVRLEGIGARMPIMTAPMQGEPFLGRRSARWKIEILRGDLDAPVEAAVRVIVNSENPDVRRMLDAPPDEPARAASRVLESMVALDMHREVIRVAIHPDTDLDASRLYEDGSLGNMLVMAVRAMEHDVETLRALHDENPAQFDVEVQGHLSQEVKLA